MKVYHVSIEQEDEWLIGHVLERPGIHTQGRSLDELVFMSRDAISLMWGEKDVHLELIVPRGTKTAFERKRMGRTGRKALVSPR